ncbi:hypothetical protein, partial [Streptomyces afghaniensis]|uniref:hypothetical protein n=1 Tax=Streptomyces afghaniensis TaxID=66865 RepID=UPI003CC83B5F
MAFLIRQVFLFGAPGVEVVGVLCEFGVAFAGCGDDDHGFRLGLGRLGDDALGLLRALDMLSGLLVRGRAGEYDGDVLGGCRGVSGGWGVRGASGAAGAGV